MAAKENSKFARTPGQDSHHQRVSVISKTLVRGGSYLSAEMKLAYLTAPANSTGLSFNKNSYFRLSWCKGINPTVPMNF